MLNWLTRAGRVDRLQNREYKVDAMLSLLDDFATALHKAAEINEAVECEIKKIQNEDIRHDCLIRLAQVRRAMGWKLVNPVNGGKSDG